MDECVLSPDGLIERLKEIGEDLFIVGDGAIEYGGMLTEALGKKAQIADGTKLLPQAHNLALLALRRLSKGESDDITSLVPNYVRQSDAEIGFKGSSL